MAAASYTVHARSSGTFGRVLANARHHHVVVDGPVQNGCPGEAITPVELFLGGIASCGVELIEVIAKDRKTPLTGVSCAIEGTIDRTAQPREDVTLFSEVALRFELAGVTGEQGAELVEAFKAR